MPQPVSVSPDQGGQDSPQRETYPRWRALSWFALYRLCLATGLNLAFLPLFAHPWSGTPANALSISVSVVYLILVLIGLVLTHFRGMRKAHLAQTGVFIDILAFTLLMHGSGGVESGFGLLLAIAVAAGALLMEGRPSLLFASLATFGVMAEQTYVQLYGDGTSGGFTRAGLLGVTYFTVAILAHVLYRRIQETETLAASRQVDIADLSKLNEFIIHSMATGVLVVDEQRRVRLMNTAAGQLLGVPVSARQPLLVDAAPALAAWLAGHIADSPGYPGPDTITVKEHEITPSYLLLGDRPSGAILLFLRDKRALIQEAQQIKLASLGRLTASIAHNVRNPLSAVKHAGQLLAESPALPEEDRKLIRIILRNTGRIDEIVESVLQLSRRNQAASRTLEVGPWLRDFCVELRESRRLQEGRCQLDIAADTPDVNVDPRHLHQVLSNLCDNAINHAGAPDRPARLTLHTGRAEPQGPAFIEVRDDGPGIDPEIAREMFAPFYTTSVSGTGLGLYIALELSETNGIDLEYAALKTGGSSFRLTFPIR